MTQQTKKRYSKSKTQTSSSAQSSHENMFWIMGFVLLVFGVFASVSTLSHFLNWASDLSALNNDESLSGVVVPFENI